MELGLSFEDDDFASKKGGPEFSSGQKYQAKECAKNVSLIAF